MPFGDRFLEENVGPGAPGGGAGERPESAEEVLDDLLKDPEVIKLIQGTGGGSGNAAAARAAALKQLDIQKKRLLFQRRTGLRDIEQAREKGLRGAINNALQRGIFRSGIRIENEEIVEREADEASSDLKENIDLSLQLIKAQRQGVRAGSGGGGFVPGLSLPQLEVIASDIFDEQQRGQSILDVTRENIAANQPSPTPSVLPAPPPIAPGRPS